MIYIFDVDGTLTPSRERIDARFELWFTRFCRTHTVCLATGSDIDKTREQLGDPLVNLCTYSFNCNGADVYYKGGSYFSSSWKAPDDLYTHLEHALYKSSYIHHYGRHIEERCGMVNFSIVGRDAQGQERTHYYEWDKISREREALCKTINSRWPSIEARVGGETSIDISARGSDKSQILDYLHGESITFFGDRCESPGNDAPLAEALSNRSDCVVHPVDGWRTTWDILKGIDEIKYEYEKKFASRV